MPPSNARYSNLGKSNGFLLPVAFFSLFFGRRIFHNTPLKTGNL